MTRQAAVAAILAAALGSASPGAAQQMPDPGPHMPALLACLGRSTARAGDEACKGVVYAACEAAQSEGERYTTIGMSLCALTETAAWDAVLNADWKRLRAVMQRQDEADGGDRDGMLLKAQRAWLAFRDADCAFETARWGEGSMRQIAGAGCHADRTAGREIEFRDILREEAAK